ncbi:MAG TPA: ABC transporter substrate-binding protein [Chitinophagales bacterium]|nr:ABC transporter substrate-binding protein [Chitinophagales bacterium]
MMRIGITLLAVLFLASCNNNSKTASGEKREAKGGVKYGGVFRYNEVEYLKTLYPQGVTEVTGHRITTQIFEGLVGFNQKDLTIEPMLAKSWDVDSTATVYTFHLRSGVVFHDDACFADGKGRAVTAKDFVYCFNMLCTPDAKNQGFSFYRDIIKGAADLYAAREKKQHDADELGNFGVKALDDTTLQITLVKPYADLLNRLGLPFAAVFPHEAVEKYKGDIPYHPVGTGPFVLKALKADEAVVMARNEKYWGKDEFGNQLPYLDGIKISFIKEDKTEMLELVKGNLEMKYRLPFSMIDQILDEQKNLKADYKKFQMQVTPEYATQFYGFLIPDKIFQDKNVRLAFNYALDRVKIADYTAKGEGVPAMYGFAPLGMPGYDNAQVKGYTFDVKKAKEYLAKAGYPDGKGFPKITLEINSGGGRNQDVAEAIKTMLTDNLNIEIELTQVIWAQHINNIETGKVGFWRFGWVADYPDPNNFFNLFYGKNVPATMEESAYTNPTRYKNKDYDFLYEKSLVTTDAAERNKIYAQLDQMIVDDAPVLLIYYSMNRRLLQPYVKNCPNNGMEYRSFREVWFDK